MRTRRACPRHTLLLGAIGAGGKPLGQHRIHVVSNPATVQALGGVVQRVLGKPITLSQLAKSALAVQLLRARNGPRHLPGGIGAQVAQAPLSLGEDRVIELPCRFQMGAQPLRLAGSDVQGHLQEKGGRPFALLSCLLVRCLFPAHGG
jgi:hypothetical protein